MSETLSSPSEKFSPEFDALIKGGKHVRHFLKENGINVLWLPTEARAWNYWKTGRQPIAKIIDNVVDPKQKDITVLDMGCANGFLLRCLQEWSSHTIEPYGIDTNKKRIYDARRLFPGKENHFAKDKKEAELLPEQFDVVYWNAWDSYFFHHDYQIEYFTSLKAKAGKLIVGFYDHDPQDRYAKIQRFRELGYEPLGIKDSKGTQTFAWYEGDQSPTVAVEN